LFFYENFNIKKFFFFFRKLFSEISEYIIFKKINFILKIIQKKNSEHYFNIFKFILRIFKFIFIFFNLKSNFLNFKNLILCGMPRQHHVAKVAQSSTATWPKPCQISWIVGSGTFLKQFFFCRDDFQFFFCRDENQNTLKLQRRKTYLSLF